MSLQLTDQFYLQRPKPGASSKEYIKIKTTISEINTYIVGGITTDYNDLSDRLDQEIVDRIDGDNDLTLQIEQVNNRIAAVGAEIFNIVVSGTFNYRIAQLCKEGYTVSRNTCGGISNPILLEDCLDTALQSYHQCVADNILYDSRGSAYLIANVYDYEGTESFFLSTVDADGTAIVYEDIFPGDYIEIVGTKLISDSNGNEVEVIDNSNYAIYEITKTSEEIFDEANDTDEKLLRFDVRYRNSSGKPSVNNRYFVKIMLDMERQLGKSYVQRKGDLMYGSLTVAVEDVNNPINGVLATGIECRNRVSGMTLNITGTGSRGFSNLLPDLVFTSQDTVKINFATPGQVIYDYQNATHVIWRRAGLDFLVYNSREEDSNGDLVTNPYLTVVDKVIFNSPVEYLTAFNLLTPENNRPEILAPKGYVDLMDDVLDAKITDINNRIDTLANASETFRYDMIIDNLIQQCEDDLNNETDPTSYTNGLAWANCVSNAIIAEADGGLFTWKGPFNNDYQDDDGNAAVRDVDLVVLDSRASIYEDPDMTMVDINWQENINIGDYFEIATTALRNTAYAVYRCVDRQFTPEGNAILTGVTLFKSDEDIVQGYIYKVKKYDKTSGLTLDDTEARYVKKSGDTMTGALVQTFDPGQTTNIHTVENKNEDPSLTTRIKFSVDSDGVVKSSKLTVVPSDGSAISGVEQAYLSGHSLSMTTTSNNVPAKFFNASGGGFSWYMSSEANQSGPVMRIGPSYLDVYNKQVYNVKNPSRNHHALTWDWLNTNLTATTPVEISKPRDNSTTGGMDISLKTMFLTEESDLRDVNSKVANDSIIDNAYLRWDKKRDRGDGVKGCWRESDAPLKEFKPGNKVATLSSTDSELQQYGFYYNASTNSLFFRV